MWNFLYILIAIILLTSLSSSTPIPNTYLSRNHISHTPKLSLAESAEWTEYHVREPEGPGTYSFGYDVEDSETGNIQFRTEERSSNGTVVGSYGFVSPDGNVHVVHYIADRFGYRTKIEDAKRSKFSSNYKSTKTIENISPEMQAALNSLGNMKQKEDQHVRPIDIETVNTVHDMPVTQTNHYPDENVYNVYFVPSNNNN